MHTHAPTTIVALSWVYYSKLDSFLLTTLPIHAHTHTQTASLENRRQMYQLRFSKAFIVPVPLGLIQMDCSEKTC